MRVLVTGGAGFIASHIVDELIKLKHHVCIVDNLSAGNEENINQKAIFYKYSITDMEKLKLVFEVEHPEVVIHHAAQINVRTSLSKP
ncbi:MAG: UDP-glucose 4-epimerase [Clostridium sp.]|jgi:UDP-glucose 4-epimerase